MNQLNKPEEAGSALNIALWVRVGLVFSMVGVITLLGFSFWQWQNDSRASSESASFIKTFGPGGSPHASITNPSALQVADIARLPNDIPPPLNRATSAVVEVRLEAKEVVAEIAPGVEYPYITYNGTVPGPFIRAREGDTVKIVLTNPATSIGSISIDLHGATGPGGGGAVQVLPGETKSFKFKALFPGLFIYHTASGNIPQSVASGGYGLILVEPKNGLEKVDREFYVMQGDFFLEGPIGKQGLISFSPKRLLEEDPSYIVFNGRVGALKDHPLEAKVGEKIRIYWGVADVSGVSSAHIIGEIFDAVYLEASLLSPPIRGVQTTIVPAGGATVIDLTLDYPGDYILVDHSLARLEKGVWGVLRVTGATDPDIFEILR